MARSDLRHSVYHPHPSPYPEWKLENDFLYLVSMLLVAHLKRNAFWNTVGIGQKKVNNAHVLSSVQYAIVYYSLVQQRKLRYSIAQYTIVR
jgi:hypothetical protein